MKKLGLILLVLIGSVDLQVAHAAEYGRARIRGRGEAAAKAAQIAAGDLAVMQYLVAGDLRTEDRKTIEALIRGLRPEDQEGVFNALYYDSTDRAAQALQYKLQDYLAEAGQ